MQIARLRLKQGAKQSVAWLGDVADESLVFSQSVQGGGIDRHAGWPGQHRERNGGRQGLGPCAGNVFIASPLREPSHRALKPLPPQSHLSHPHSRAQRLPATPEPPAVVAPRSREPVHCVQSTRRAALLTPPCCPPRYPSAAALSTSRYHPSIARTRPRLRPRPPPHSCPPSA